MLLVRERKTLAPGGARTALQVCERGDTPPRTRVPATYIYNTYLNTPVKPERKIPGVKGTFDHARSKEHLPFILPLTKPTRRIVARLASAFLLFALDEAYLILLWGTGIIVN